MAGFAYVLLNMEAASILTAFKFEGVFGFRVLQKHLNTKIGLSERRF